MFTFPPFSRLLQIWFVPELIQFSIQNQCKPFHSRLVSRERFGTLEHGCNPCCPRLHMGVLILGELSALGRENQYLNNFSRVHNCIKTPRLFLLAHHTDGLGTYPFDFYDMFCSPDTWASCFKSDTWIKTPLNLLLTPAFPTEYEKCLHLYSHTHAS